MKIISHLVAVSNDLVIGVDNDLPWNLKDDLAHFKKYTLNKIIIMVLLAERIDPALHG